MNFTQKYSIYLAGLVLLMTGCTVGPDYVKPEVTSPVAFKEAEGWKVAEPQDHVPRGNWWEVFNDAELNGLEQQVAISNQNLRAAEARFRQAQALVSSSRADYFPSITGSATHTRSKTSILDNSIKSNSPLNNRNTLTFNLNWEADVWGRISRTVEAADASVDASAADIAAALLSAQAELAQDYFAMQVADSQQQLLQDSIKAYQKSMEVTQNRYNAGVASKADVVQAEAQLKSTQAQAADVGIQRAQMEHAIALLIGKAPVELTLKPAPLTVAAPDIPLSMPSTLLERRPDIAAAERRTAAANAQIGVAQAAFYPSLSLTAGAGFQSMTLANFISKPNLFWSLGAALATTIFDAGKRRAVSDQAIATYEENVANYRQTVLTGFQEVEDSLVALRVLQDEQKLQEEALTAARASLTYTTNQYKAGTVSYLDVVTASNIALSNERTLVDLHGRQFANSVLLIKALGGGWAAPAP